MNRKSFAFYFLITLVILLILFWLFPGRKMYYKMSIEEIDRDIRRIAEKDLSHQEKIAYYSERFLNAPYDLTCEGDGVDARYDRQPLLNLKKVNCMTYCEIVLALTLADYYEDFFNILLHIRYRQGIIGMATRNHYTMADWLPANSWCLDDVSRKIGEDDTRQVTRNISHKKFFKSKRIHDIPVHLPDREITIDYVPFEHLRDHQYRLKTGDIVALIQNKPGIFSAHMLLVIKEGNQILFRHAPIKAGKVIDSPFEEYLIEVSHDPRYMGMSFMRLKDHIQWRDGAYTHGKFLVE